jgi:hypothetical protein
MIAKVLCFSSLQAGMNPAESPSKRPSGTDECPDTTVARMTSYAM